MQSRFRPRCVLPSCLCGHGAVERIPPEIRKAGAGHARV
jgi:hypothetical protein